MIRLINMPQHGTRSAREKSKDRSFHRHGGIRHNDGKCAIETYIVLESPDPDIGDTLGDTHYFPLLQQVRLGTDSIRFGTLRVAVVGNGECPYLPICSIYSLSNGDLARHSIVILTSGMHGVSPRSSLLVGTIPPRHRIRE